MENASSFFYTFPGFMAVASAIVICVVLLSCATKRFYKTKNIEFEMILTGAVAEENATRATIACKLQPTDQKFSFIRWYRTGNDGKPIGDVLAEIHYGDSNTQPDYENDTDTELRSNELQAAIYVNENRTISRNEAASVYANVKRPSGVHMAVNMNDSGSENSESDDENRMMCETTLGDIATSSSVCEPVYSKVNNKTKLQKAPGYMQGGLTHTKEGKYKAFMDIRNGNGGLTIYDVKLEDVGNYTCYVFLTGIVKAKVTSQLSVTHKIMVSVNDVNAFENQDRSVDMICTYTPKEEIISHMKWYKITPQGETLLASSDKPSRGGRFEAMHSTGGGYLRIKDPVSGDKGMYKCEVIRNNLTVFSGNGVLTLPVRLFPFHRESPTTVTSYRRPAIISFVQSNCYHLIAFCEKRRTTVTTETRSIVALRGLVRGSHTIEWEKQQVTVYSKEIDTTVLQRNSLKTSYKENHTLAWPENPVPIVVNQKRGHIVVLFNTFTSTETRNQRSPDWQLFSAHSEDGGKTWPEVKQHFPWNIERSRRSGTYSERPPRHFELNTGHGIKLSTGTLLVNGLVSKVERHSINDKKLKRQQSSVLVQVVLTGGKDGKQWRPICKLGRGSSSETLSDTFDDDEEFSLSMSQTNTHSKESKNCRNFGSPGCQAGLVSFKAPVEVSIHSPTWVLCSRPMETSDKKFTVRLSKDGCNTWSKESLLLKDGRVGSSDLAYFEGIRSGCPVTTMRMFGCIYESVSKKDGKERLTLVFNIFTLNSLLQADRA